MYNDPILSFLSWKHHFHFKNPGRMFFLILVFTLINPFPLGYASALAIPNPPALTLPVDYAQITATGEAGTIATPPLAVPSFTWEPVAGATSYRLQIAQNTDFNNNLREFTTPLTRYTPTNAGDFNDGIWYWRVKVDAPEASQYSTFRTFTKTWKSPENKPTLTTPTVGANVDFYNSPVFSWQPVLGAASYKFQISPASDFTTIRHEAFTLATQYQPREKIPNGTNYYWRVIPIDPANHEGTSSDARSFNQNYNFVPTQIEPADDSTPTFTPTFRWTAVRGAQKYRLQYSTDPFFNYVMFSTDTWNTTFTPTYTLENDKNYYWRVKAISGISESAWSSVWNFMKQWYIKPVPLTPTNLFQYVRFPFFSWTPVPGAQHYKIQVDDNSDLSSPFLEADTANPFYTPHQWSGGLGWVWWKVTPYDGSGFKGVSSDTVSFRKAGDFNTPNQIYPFYYYVPNQFPAPDQQVAMNPFEDRSVGLPIFVWNRLTDVYTGVVMAPAYRLQVGTHPITFNEQTIVWQVDTQNQYAVTIPNEFATINDNTTYYWRLHALDSGNNLLVNSEWSQIWKVKFNSAKRLSSTTGTAPQPLRPARASEIVDSTPMFEWRPYTGALDYQIQVSQDVNFGSTVLNATTSYPAYAPRQMIAQRNLGLLNFGTYYWRVRARTGVNTYSQYSTPWRFQIAAPSEWTYTRTLGDLTNREQIAADIDSPPAPTADYNLNQLSATQDQQNWYIGFDAPAGTGNADFVLYLDKDHIDGSGADEALVSVDFPPITYNLTTIPGHQPEFAIVILKRANQFTAANVALYAWNKTTLEWTVINTLDQVGGSIFPEAISSPTFVELKLPNTSIGMDVSAGSYAVALFSFAVGGGAPKDSTPSDPLVPGSGQISRFASVSERMNPVYPFNDLELDPNDNPFAYPSVPPFFWEYQSVKNYSHLWAGARMETHLDRAYTSQRAEFNLESTGPYYSPTSHAWPTDMVGDNTYYWRLRTRYFAPQFFGTWVGGWRFERRGFLPDNLSLSTVIATPTFSWSMTEGAQSYDLQVSTDQNYQNLVININTTQNTFTSNGTLWNGTYYWRVRVKRNGGVTNEWKYYPGTFDLRLPTPIGLTPNDPGNISVVHATPTFCWQPLIASVGPTPVLAAFKYRIQVSKGDPSFSQIYELFETEQACYTPTRGYDDGKYYWRVALLDGEGKNSDYSAVAEFTKQYPITTLVSPLSGNVSQTPTFVWTPVFGAARYRLEISNSSIYSSLYEAIETNQISFTPTHKYDVDRTYYWRVAIIDRDGKIGPYTDATIIFANTNKVYLPLTVR